ncbi:MAG TPA: glycosyl hydrolase, partial [bacterium]|nr:glycosyl hydrolase [bacterium]
MNRREFLKTITAGYAITVLPFPMWALSNQRASGLESGFRNPPDSARAHTWWHWMNGNVTEDGITRDLEAMKEAGLGGFQAFHVTDRIPHGPVGYDTDEWHKLMAHTIRKADSLGLEMCFHNCAGWSSSGGPWITPETSMKTVVWSEVQIRGPQESFDGWLEEPESNHNYYNDIAVLAFPTPAGERGEDQGFRLINWRAKAGYEREDRPEPDTRSISPEETIPISQIIDLTDQMQADGRLNWEVPEGHWTVVRFGYTTTGVTNHPAPPEGEGLECDKLSKEGAEAHWNGIVTKVLEDAGPRAGRTLNSVLIDSYETDDQNWTQQFAEEFNRRRGYDILAYLPCVTGRVVGSIEVSERFLWDFRRTIADMFAENYYGRFAQLCEQNGLKLYVEPYGRSGFFDDFANASQADIPMGEFWVNRYDAWHWWSSKLASSAAHAYGRKYVGSETFTAGGNNAAWINHPYSLKTLGDYFYCQGINRFIFHEYAHQPWPDFKPGMTMGPHGFQMNRGNTWWNQSADWLTYLARSQYMLQEGRFVADICYYFGENAPNTLVREHQLRPVPPDGYDYDAFVTDVLMQLEVENGELVLPGGMRYSVLVLPHFDRTMRPEVLRKIRDLVRNGATVVGPKPIRSPSLSNHPDCDEQVRSLADEIWGNANGTDITRHESGRGRV